MIRQKGFTLIELLVVVAIIGILAAVGVVAFDGFVKTSKRNTADKICHDTIRQVKLIWAARHAGVPCHLLNSWGNLDTRSDMCTHNSSMSMTAGYFGDHFQKTLNPYRTHDSQGTPQRAWNISCPLDHAMKPGCNELFGAGDNQGDWQNPNPDLTGGGVFLNPGNLSNCNPYCRKDEFIFQCYNLDSDGNLIKYREHFQTNKAWYR